MGLEKYFNSKQIALTIDLLKKIPFLYLNIYGEILLNKNQQKILEERRNETDTVFLSEILNTKPKAVYFADTKILSYDDNPLEHELQINPKLLRGDQIIKIGFLRLYGRSKRLKEKGGSFPVTLISIEKEKKGYKLKIPVYDNQKEYLKDIDKDPFEKEIYKLISIIENNIY